MVLLIDQKLTHEKIKGFSSKLSTYPLITIDQTDVLTKLFLKELRHRDVSWLPQIEVDSLEMVSAYVAKGFGIGLSVKAPSLSFPSSIQAIPLRGFPLLRAGIIWRNKLSPIGESFVQLAHEYIEGIKK